MYNVNKSFYRDNSLKTIGHLEKLGVVRYHDTFKYLWKTRANNKKIHSSFTVPKLNVSVSKLKGEL